MRRIEHDNRGAADQVCLPVYLSVMLQSRSGIDLDIIQTDAGENGHVRAPAGRSAMAPIELPKVSAKRLIFGIAVVLQRAGQRHEERWPSAGGRRGPRTHAFRCSNLSCCIPSQAWPKGGSP